MAIGRTNAGSGGGLNKSILIVSAPTGATLTATLGDTVKTASEKTPGEYWLRNLDVGEWNLKLTKGEQTATAKYNIPEFGVYRTSMAFFLSAADFVWGGTKGTDYEIVQDDDTVIPEEDYPKYKNWKARILTSIAVTPKRDAKIDVFLVGGGASGGGRGGGGGGYTKTQKSVSVKAGIAYPIIVGAGGVGPTTENKVPPNAGGATSAFGLTANGGEAGSETGNYPSSGGSGGGSGRTGGAGYSGGSDGSRGGGNGAFGQGTTTREFEEANGTLYAGGGGGGAVTTNEASSGGAGGGGDGGGTSANPRPKNGGENTGGGGGGIGDIYYTVTYASGGSGIVIIRNARGAA